MDTTNSSENPQRRVEDRKPSETIDWEAPGAPAVPQPIAHPIGQLSPTRIESPIGAAPAATSGDAPDLQRISEILHGLPIAPTTAQLDEAAKRIARIESAAAPVDTGGTMLGVGDGSGKLFVRGDYDSIKAVQSIIFENERLRSASPATASGDERADFEAWHRSKFATKHCTGQPTRDMHNGVYAEKYGPEDQQLMWEAFQAGAAVSAATKPTADLSKLTRWTFDGGMTAEVSSDGQWYSVADVQSLLATKSAAAQALPGCLADRLYEAICIAHDRASHAGSTPRMKKWADTAADLSAALAAATPAASTTGAAQTAEQVRESGTDEAIQRACRDLPQGYSIRIDLERGAGCVEWMGPLGGWSQIEGEGFISDDLNAAIEACVHPTPTHSSEAGDA